jgi:hypothetical protein
MPRDASEEERAMIRREGRLDSSPVEVRKGLEVPRTVVVRNWERPIFVIALIAILVLGGIAGLNSLMALFP